MGARHYITVSSNGITLHSPKSEMGQGVMATVAAMVAEELDVDLDQVTVTQAPAGYAHYNSVVVEEAAPVMPFDHTYLAETVRAITDVPAKMVLKIQNTGGSSSVPETFDKRRKAGAAARVVFVEAAAEKTRFSADDLRTENGGVITPGGQSLAYTDLVELAAQIEPIGDPPLKTQSAWRLLGKSLDRIDMVPKCVGATEFGVDVQIERMLFATIWLNPRIGGDVDAALPSDRDVWTYCAPYLAHATMEPLNATVRYTPERTDIWVGTQGQTKARELAAKALGVPEVAVFVHTKYLGGGFGRRGEQDMILHAAMTAKALPGIPVKMTLSREEGICQGLYRPAAMAKISGHAADGKIQALDAQFAAP